MENYDYSQNETSIECYKTLVDISIFVNGSLPLVQMLFEEHIGVKKNVNKLLYEYPFAA